MTAPEYETDVLLGTLTLPGVERSVAYARHFLRDLLPVGSPVVYDLMTVASELVSNAIAHTRSGLQGGQVTVQLLARPGVLRVEVVDDGAEGARPHVKAESGCESGRGIHIVQELTARWGYDEDGARTIVWAEFRSGLPS